MSGSSDSSQTLTESLSNTSLVLVIWQKSLNLFNQVSASSAVVTRKGGRFRLSILISESEPLSTSSVSCTDGNGDDDGALVEAEGPALVYVTETKEDQV